MAVANSQAGNWPLTLLKEIGKPNTSNSNRWLIQTNDDWIAVSRNDLIKSDYECKELISITSKIIDPSFYLIESHSENIMQGYLMQLPESVDALIDNDHGWIANVSEYKRAISENADWLYRS